MTNYTEKLSDFAAHLRFDDLPQKVVEQTKMFIADYIAASFAGYRVNFNFNKTLLSLVDEMGGAEQSSVLFSLKKYPVCNAAFVNAMYAHGADLDDGNRKAAGHIGTHVLSAVFALSQTLSVSWEDIFIAINIGYEVFNRTAGAAQPSLYNKGFHSTGVAGSLACAAPCGRLLGLDSSGIYNAISLGAIQSNGLILIDESGQSCKPLNPANAARAGVISAQLASKGIVSSRNPLESRKGWFNAFSDGVDEDVLLGELGQEYSIMDSYLKLYPSCRHTHSVIEAAIKIRKRMVKLGILTKHIDSIEVNIYPYAINSAGFIKHPSTPDEAKFSIFYGLSTALQYGRFGLSDLKCENTSTEVRRLTDKTQLISDISMEDREAGIRGAKVRVRMNDGMIIDEKILIPKGEAMKPLTWHDIEAKMDVCAEGFEVDAHELIGTIRNLDLSKPFTPWMSWL